MFLSRFGNLIVEDEPVYKSELTGGLGYTAGFYSQIADSTSITDTTTESSLIGSGIGTLSVPANTFKQGNAYIVKMAGRLSTPNLDTITFRVKSGSVILGTTGAITLRLATNTPFDMHIHFVIRNEGVSGVATILTHFLFSYEEDASDTFESHAFININNTTFDTTISNTLDITAQWGQQDVQDIIYSQAMNLNKIF